MPLDDPTATRPAPLPLPGSGDWLAWVAERGEGQLAEARRLVDELKASTDAGAEAVLDRWNDAQTAIGNAA